MDTLCVVWNCLTAQSTGLILSFVSKYDDYNIAGLFASLVILPFRTCIAVWNSFVLLHHAIPPATLKRVGWGILFAFYDYSWPLLDKNEDYKWQAKGVYQINLPAMFDLVTIKPLTSGSV